MAKIRRFSPGVSQIGEKLRAIPGYRLSWRKFEKVLRASAGLVKNSGRFPDIAYQNNLILIRNGRVETKVVSNCD